MLLKLRYSHPKMFGTELVKINGIHQVPLAFHQQQKVFFFFKNPYHNHAKDPCSGDSGGPLMVQDKATSQWTIIGNFRKEQTNMYP